MNRRNFLQSVSALALLRPRPDTPKVIIKNYDDGWTVDVGCIRCLTFNDGSEISLVFGVFLVEGPMPGVVEETRMAPTQLLRKRLESVGFPVVWHPGQLALDARMNFCPSPKDVAARLHQVLAGCNSRLLYQNLVVSP